MLRSIEQVSKLPVKLVGKKAIGRAVRQADQAIRKQAAQLHIFEGNIAEAQKSWEQRVLEYGGDYLAAGFTGQPFVLLSVSQWAGYAARLDQARQTMDDVAASTSEAWVPTRTVIEDNLAHNPLFFSIKGTSLNDIGGMQLPLSAADIRRIDLMIRKQAPIPIVTAGQRPHPEFYVQSIVALAATQAELNPRFPLTDQVRPLLQRLKNYWEYHTTWAISSDLVDSYLFTTKMLMGAARGSFTESLAIFIPARLHISPSSVYRIFDAHIENVAFAFLRYMVRHHRSFKRIDSLLNNISETQDVPQAFATYQATNVQAEDKLVHRLNQEYKDRASRARAEGVRELGESAQDLVKRLSSVYHRDLREMIQTSKDGVLRLPGLADSFFKEILVGMFHSKTLTVVGLSEDRQTFVTLDLIQSGRLFGVPPQLETRDSVASSLLVEDLLAPVLEQARKRNPYAEQLTPFSGYIVPISPRLSPGTTEVREPAKPRKRKAFRRALASARRHEMPQLSTESLPSEETDRHLLIFKGQVIDDQAMMVLVEKIAKGLIPNDHSLVGDIKLILASLMEDPYGPGAYKITDAPPVVEGGRRMPLRSLRGDTRRLPFNNRKYSDRLRTVYYIDPKTRSVVLDAVLTHNEFDALYVTGSH